MSDKYRNRRAPAYESKDKSNGVGRNIDSDGDVGRRLVLAFVTLKVRHAGRMCW